MTQADLPPPRPSPAADAARPAREGGVNTGFCSAIAQIAQASAIPFTYTFPATLYVNGVGVLTHHSGTSGFNGGASPTLHLPLPLRTHINPSYNYR